MVVSGKQEDEIVLHQQVEEDIRVFGQRLNPLDANDSTHFKFEVDISNLSESNLAILETNRNPQTDTFVTADKKTNTDTEANFESKHVFPPTEQIPHAKNTPQISPLAAWLSQTASVLDCDKPACFKESGDLSELNQEDIESHEIEAFRNIHIASDEQIVQDTSANPDHSNGGQTGVINLGARIFLRNIRDMYPKLPQYLAERLANANALRSQRLGFSLIENASDGSSSLSSCSKDSPGIQSKHLENAMDVVLKMINEEEIQSRFIPRPGNYLNVKGVSLEPDGKQSPQDFSYWSGQLRRRGPHSSASGSSVTNDSLHGSSEDRQSVPRSFSTGKSSGSRCINDPREALLVLPPPPIELGTQKSFSCDICGRTVEVLRKRDWRKHVFQDLEPYMCTFEDCSLTDKTYATSRAFITHEMRYHRTVARTFACGSCGTLFSRKRDARKHLHFSKCEFSQEQTKRGFNVVEERVADSVCPFCAEPITGGRKHLTQHLGRHLEEISFAVVRKPYEEWQFYEDSAVGSSPAPSVVLNRNIHQATVEGSFEQVIAILEAGADVNAEVDGKTPLYKASAAGHYALVWLLLQKGADHQKKSVDDYSSAPNLTALEAASEAGHVEVASLLATVAFDSGLISVCESALRLAAAGGHLKTLKELVRILGGVRELNHPALLYFAAKNGHTDIVEFLLFHGGKETVSKGKMHLRDSFKCDEVADPLLASLEGGHRNITLLLLDGGSCISRLAWQKAASGDDRELVDTMLANSIKLDIDLDNALIGAVDAGNAEIVVKLMEAGVVASPEAVTQACLLGNLPVLKVILQKGASPTMSDLKGAIRDGNTDIVKALTSSCPELLNFLTQQLQSPNPMDGNIMNIGLASGSGSIVELLLNYGGVLPPQKSSVKGFSLSRNYYNEKDNSLHDAAKDGHYDVVKLLLAKGFDPNIEGQYRENPLHRACQAGHSKVVRLLLEAGVNVNGTNGASLRSPMGYSMDKGTTIIVDILRQHGAVWNSV